jgi:hypothetical protein
MIEACDSGPRKIRQGSPMHQIVKKYKKKKEPIVNDALFYRAECDFQLGYYADAQDGYDELLKRM